LFTREAKSSIPTTKHDLAIVYTDQEVEDVSEDDGTYVCIDGSSPIYLLHQYKVNNTNHHNYMNIKVKGKVTLDATTSPVYLQIFNMSTSSWETLVTNDYSLSGEEFYLKASIYSDQEDYYDIFNENQVTIRVYQNNNE
jgi:hypothetical protein